MNDPIYSKVAAELGLLDLHDLFRFAAPTHDLSKLRQSLLVKQLSEPTRLFGNINELSEFLDDRQYEHSNEALSIIFSYQGDDLRQLLATNAPLRIEIGSYQKHIPASDKVPAHYVSTPVYDTPHAKDLLKGPNRSNLTLLTFKLLFAQVPQARDFNTVCDALKPKFRTIDYGLLLNEGHQPATSTDPKARSDFYLQHMKASTILLNYLMTHQVTNSLRRLHQSFFTHFFHTIQQDMQLATADKQALLQMLNLCYGYTVLSDKELAKGGTGLFSQTPVQLNLLWQMLKQPLESKFLQAEVDPLNHRYLDQQTSDVLVQCHQSYQESVALLQKNGATESGAPKKLIGFNEETEKALRETREFKP
jgi:hypothetical protein